MGIWGVKIFQDDIAEDVKDEYIDRIKQGKNNIEVTNELIEEYVNGLDEDEISVFWFALASIQWDYGRLLEEVKKKALGYIKSGQDLRRWKEEENEKNYIKRKEVLETLEKKLNSDMPQEKKVRKYIPYICEWKIGDVFAYQIKENKIYKEKYIVFIKVGNEEYYPHSICPGVYIYNKIFDEVPDLKEIQSVKYLPQGFFPSAYKGEYRDVTYKCLIGIENATKRFVEEYVYIGNIRRYVIPKNEIQSRFKQNNRELCFIKKFEEEQIRNYEMWKDNTEYWKEN